MRSVPSLVDLCVRFTIDNIKYLGDLDNYLLDRILSHCDLEQLKRIEHSNSQEDSKNQKTKGRDLSPITDKFWKKAYTDQFGVQRTNTVVERMRLRKVTFKWRQLYEAKIIEQEEATNKSADRIRQLYQEEVAKKQSRQVKVLTGVPPPPTIKKRRFWPRGDDVENDTKSIIMKKAKRDFFNCMEVKNRAAMKNKTVQRMNRYW